MKYPMGEFYFRCTKTLNFCNKAMKTMNVNDEEFFVFEEWADGIIQDSEAVVDAVFCQLCSFEGEEVCVEGVDYHFDDENVEMEDFAQEAAEAYNKDVSNKTEKQAWNEVLDGESNKVPGMSLLACFYY